jgi:plastocyanin
MDHLRRRRWLSTTLLAGALPGLAAMAFAAAAQAGSEYRLVIEGHHFTPAQLTVPAGEHIQLVVENHDATPEEFESYALNREKIVPAGARVVLYVGPLRPGRYEFFGDFNQATARGWLVAAP